MSEQDAPPSAPQATGGTKEWARSPFDTGECCCNVHGEDGRLACSIHGLTAGLPAAREARSDDSVSTVNDGENRAVTREREHFREWAKVERRRAEVAEQALQQLKNEKKDAH